MKISRTLRLGIVGLALFSSATMHSASSPQNARVIVKYRDVAIAQSVSVSRLSRLSNAAGVAVRAERSLGRDMHVVRADGVDSATLAERLRRTGLVEFAVEDRIKYARAVPNDPRFVDPPSPGQWYLRPPNVVPGQASSIDAQTAWDITTGSSAVVIAVLDSGVRLTHPDLAAKMLPGYDFVTTDCSGVCIDSRDGDGPDPDPSDPGDYYDPPGPVVYYSSWHGTIVSGIAAASTNNNAGIAGVSWGSRILPVRVLGSGGGWTSDIIAGMRWAGGLTTASDPGGVNPNPARILNMSLGGVGGCDDAEQKAVDDLLAAGVVVVAAAGNESGPVDSPGNCRGVLSVAGLRHTGTKVGYSSCGPQVGIAAPAGNCVNTGGDCVYPIVSTTNTGLVDPSPAGDTYTGATSVTVGTSFAAPQAAGVLSLMYAVNGNLTPAEAIERLKASARAFPSDPTLPTCPSVGELNTEIEGQCNCTAATCGAGMLDAHNAVREAQRPVAKATSTLNGNTITLDATASAAVTGAIVSYLWETPADSGASLTNPTQPVATLTVPANGIYTVTLTVTDNARTDTLVLPLYVGVAAPAPAAVSGSSCAFLSATPSPPPPSSGGGGGSFGLANLLGVLLLGLCGHFARRRHMATTAHRLPPA